MTFERSKGEDLTFFEAEVARQCAGILADYGFQLAASRPGSVSFMSSNVSVEIIHDRMSLEVGMLMRLNTAARLGAETSEGSDITTIGRSRSPLTFSLEDALKYSERGSKRPDAIGSFVGLNTGALASGLSRMLITAAEIAAPLLLGDRTEYERLEVRISEAAQSFTATVRNQELREEVGRAWASKDFDRVIRALESLSEPLKPSEEAKLHYSREHRSESND